MSEIKRKKWQEMDPGAVILDPGNTVEYKTGSWRMGTKPVWFEDRCTQCFICWISCPDKSILVEDGKVKGIHYDYCKGCGICAVECPTKEKSIEMVEEENLVGKPS